MSEMMRNQGIIRRISTKDNIKEVYEKLVEEGKITSTWNEFDANGVPTYIEDDDYDIINGCLFDMSGAPAEYDTDDEVEEVTKLNDTDYKIHLYYYNGGTNDSEILEEAIPKADAEYSAPEDVEKELDDIMEGLIVGHNFEYARKALLEWHNKHKG